MLKVTWAQLKQAVVSKNLSIQYTQDDNSYIITAVDGALVIQTVIPVINPSSPDQLDFETNFKNIANNLIDYTIAGNNFSISAAASLSSSTLTPLFLLVNPNTSTVNARAMFFAVSTNATQGIVTITGYSNPTVTSNGTPVSINNNFIQAGAPASALQAYALPSVSANGTSRIGLVSVANASTDMINFAQTATLAPGNSFMIAVTVTNLGLLGSANTYFFMQWVEV